MVNLLKLNNITVTRENKIILDDISLSINDQDFIVLVGTNGSGKSSLLNIINARLKFEQGDILLNNKNLMKYTAKQLATEIITLNQSIRDSLFMNLSIWENAKLIIQRAWCGQKINKNFRNNLKQYLANFKENFPNMLNQQIKFLSGGEQQLIAFALYLYHKPKLLLLDEHTSALDPKTATKLMQVTDKIIKQHKITCIMTTHSLDFALQYGNKILAMKNAKIQFQANKKEKHNISKQELLQYCY